MRNRSTPCRGSCPLRPDGQGQLQLSMWRSMERFQSIRTRCSAKCWMARIERDLDPTALRRPAQTKRNGQAGRLTSLTGTARCGAACRVVWEGWQAQSCHPDPIRALAGAGWSSVRLVVLPRRQKCDGDQNQTLRPASRAARTSWMIGLFMVVRIKVIPACK